MQYIYIYISLNFQYVNNTTLYIDRMNLLFNECGIGPLPLFIKHDLVLLIT